MTVSRARPAAHPMLGISLAGTGMALPGRILTNDDLAAMVDTSDAWISQRTGIRQRRIINGEQTLLSLATESLQAALNTAHLQGADLDMVFVATMSPQMATPGTASRLASDVGATGAGALDVNAACSGFVYAMNMATNMIHGGTARHVAVVGAEVLSELVDWRDRRTCVLFGDGAGAAILSATDARECGCLYQEVGSDGHGWKELYCPRTADDLPEDDQVFSGTFNTLQMNGREIYRFAVTRLEKCIDNALTATGLAPADLDAIVVHQSNARIIEGTARRLNLKMDRFYVNIDRFGNTAAASIPMCLHEMAEAGRLKPGNLVLLAGLGGGLTWASSLWRL